MVSISFGSVSASTILAGETRSSSGEETYNRCGLDQRKSNYANLALVKKMNGTEKSAQRAYRRTTYRKVMCDSCLDSACIAFDGNPVLEQPHLLLRYISPKTNYVQVSCESALYELYSCFCQILDQ